MSEEDRHFHELTECVFWHYNGQREDRDRHRELSAYMLNDFYPNGGRPRQYGLPETSVPLISMTARAWSRYTIAKSPRVSAHALDPGLEDWAKSRETSTNQRIQRSHLDRELREFTNDSFCSLGIMHIGPVWEGTNEGYRLDLETRAIDRADYLTDLSGNFPETCDLQGHLFEMPLIDVRQNPQFNENKEKVYATGDVGDRENDRRPNRFHDLYRMVRIACVYERRRNRLIYYPWEQRDLKLAEREWFGPAQGPYLYLYYEKPPGFATPIAPLSHLAVKHRSTNILDAKAMDQEHASKGCLFYTNASEEEARRMVNARNNQSVLAESGAVRYGYVGGASQGLVAMTEKQRRDYSWAAGNLDSYAGLTSAAPTLGQERLLRGAANEMLSDMGEYAQLAMHDLANRLFWFDGQDPDPNPQTLIKRHNGTPYAVPWTLQHRQFAMMHEYDCTVEPYSYVMRTPENRLADILGAVQIYQSLRGEASAQGMMLNVQEIWKTIAETKNLPELYKVMVMNEDPAKLMQMMGMGSSQQANKPQGHYTRESRSDGSSQEVEMLRALGNSQEAMRSVA